MINTHVISHLDDGTEKPHELWIAQVYWELTGLSDHSVYSFPFIYELYIQNLIKTVFPFFLFKFLFKPIFYSQFESEVRYAQEI